MFLSRWREGAVAKTVGANPRSAVPATMYTYRKMASKIFRLQDRASKQVGPMAFPARLDLVGSVEGGAVLIDDLGMLAKTTWRLNLTRDVAELLDIAVTIGTVRTLSQGVRPIMLIDPRQRSGCIAVSREGRRGMGC